MSHTLRTLKTVTAQPPSFLQLRWSGGITARVDLATIVDPWSLHRLVRAGLFTSARVADCGRSVAWADGSRISADRLWLETLSVIGRPDVREFLEWRIRNALSLSKAAEALGISRRTVVYYSKGDRAVPKRVLLACNGWEVARKREWDRGDFEKQIPNRPWTG